LNRDALMRLVELQLYAYSYATKPVLCVRVGMIPTHITWVVLKGNQTTKLSIPYNYAMGPVIDPGNKWNEITLSENPIVSVEVDADCQVDHPVDIVVSPFTGFGCALVSVGCLCREFDRDGGPCMFRTNSVAM